MQSVWSNKDRELSNRKLWSYTEKNTWLLWLGITSIENVNSSIIFKKYKLILTVLNTGAWVNLALDADVMLSMLSVDECIPGLWNLLLFSITTPFTLLSNFGSYFPGDGVQPRKINKKYTHYYWFSASQLVIYIL